MKQGVRVLVAVAVALVMAGVVLGTELIRRRNEGAELPPGSIPIYTDGRLAAFFELDDLEELERASFIDDEEGKTQEGWLLMDVLTLVLPSDTLVSGATIVVSSSSRDKSFEMAWDEVRNQDNMVMLDLSGRGTLKLVSKLEGLAVRDEWIQDVDRIDVK